MSRARAMISALAISAVLVAVAAPVRAQCDGRWLPGDASSTILGTVNDAVVWDPDGEGPEQEWFLMCGSECTFGYSFTATVGAFDGRNWRSLGVTPAGVASALVIHNGQPVVAVNNSLYRWNGVQWGVFAGANTIYALTVHQGDIIAAGRFMVGGVLKYGVARHTGNSWVVIGEVSGTPGWYDVHGVQVIGDHLFATGRFDLMAGVAAAGVARWDGQAWVGFNSADITSVEVRSIAECDGDLFGAGRFVRADGVQSTYARWIDTGWQLLVGDTETGTWMWPPSMAAHEGELYLEGGFCRYPAFCPLARWRDGPWTIERTPDTMVDVGPLLRWRGSLVAIGMFSFLPGQNTGTNRIVILQDGDWRIIPESPSGPPRGITPYQDGLAVCGSFGAVGGDAIGRVARWDGAHWHPIGQPFHNGVVDAIWGHQGDLYAAAESISTPDGFLNGVIKFDGERWRTVLYVSPPRTLRFASFGELLVIGGSFTTLGGVSASRIAAWDGTTVSPFGNGFNGDVYSMCVFRGELYAAGSFSFSGAAPVGSVARWDGSQWRRLATLAPGGTIYAMCVHEDRLYVGGTFATPPALGSPSILAWDGATWSGVGGGITGTVHDIESDGTQLFVVGSMTRAGALNVNNAVRWDGTQWRTLGSGLQYIARQSMLDAAVFEGELVVGSGLLIAGGNTSAFFARWSIAGTPRISDDPADATASLNGSASFTVTPAPGYDPLTFRWQMHDPPVPGEWRDLADGPLVIAGQEVALLSGASAATLTIAPSFNFGGMTLRAVVANACGEALSEPAALTVANCDPDLNCDGSADQGDLACLVLALAGDPSCFCRSDPDFNLDGSADQGDVAALIGVVAGGECP